MLDCIITIVEEKEPKIHPIKQKMFLNCTVYKYEIIS